MRLFCKTSFSFLDTRASSWVIYVHVLSLRLCVCCLPGCGASQLLSGRETAPKPLSTAFFSPTRVVDPTPLQCKVHHQSVSMLISSAACTTRTPAAGRPPALTTTTHLAYYCYTGKQSKVPMTCSQVTGPTREPDKISATYIGTAVAIARVPAIRRENNNMAKGCV